MVRTLCAWLAFSICGLTAGCGDSNDHTSPDEPSGSVPISGGAGGGPTNEAAPPPVVEAGFLDLAHPQFGPGEAGKMFFSFQPADQHPERAPLVILFNGGPGQATSEILLPFGTGPMTLEAWATPPLVAKPNPASWTRFANLLYLDPRDSGFSYELGSAGCVPPDNRDVAVIDAADFALAILDFLDAHPALTASPVVFAGEAYGGARAMLIARLLLDGVLPDEARKARLDLTHAVPDLPARVERHLAAATAQDPSFDLRAQFHHAILIEPAFGPDEIRYELDALPPLGDELDHNDSRHTHEEGAAFSAAVSLAMHDPATVEALLGVPLASIPGFAAANRANARRLSPDVHRPNDAGSDAAFDAALGGLDAGDTYWMSSAQVCSFSIDVLNQMVSYEMIPELDLFITRARYDHLVHTDAWPSFLGEHAVAANLVGDQPRGAARPGVVEIPLKERTMQIRFPEYDSGHQVSATAGPELAADVADWFADRGLSR